MLIKHWKRGRNLEFPFDTDFSFFEKTGGLAPIQRFELWPVTVNRLELVEMLRYRIKNKSTAAKAVPLGHWCETTFVPQLIGHWHLKFNAQHKQRTWRKARKWVLTCYEGNSCPGPPSKRGSAEQNWQFGNFLCRNAKPKIWAQLSAALFCLCTTNWRLDRASLAGNYLSGTFWLIREL